MFTNILKDLFVFLRYCVAF